MGRGVEVGVQQGVFSDRLLENWRGRELVSVDPWQAVPATEYIDRSNVSQPEQDEFYAKTQRRLDRHGSRSTIWRLTSLEAAERIGTSDLDFAYLDARHDYESVKRDLEAWFDKVRPGGIIAGHDYVDGFFLTGEYGVKRAVDEFFASRRMRVHVTLWDEWQTWLVAVPVSGRRTKSGRLEPV